MRRYIDLLSGVAVIAIALGLLGMFIGMVASADKVAIGSFMLGVVFFGGCSLAGAVLWIWENLNRRD